MWSKRFLSALRAAGVLVGLMCLTFLTHVGVATAAYGERSGIVEEEVTFEGAGIQLNGTVLVPEGDETVPGIVLVHGAGPHTRDSLRQDAQAFAERGIATLIYDKRQEGYSQFERSYELLAEDAVAAVETLSAHPRVDTDGVGVWGLSEGAWVAPLAVNESDAIQFLITVGASGVSPLQQTSWAIDNNFADRGVTGSLRDMVTTTGLRVQRGIGTFAEADFDPVPHLQQLDVPVLALWGAEDETAPPTESARIMTEAIEQSDSPHLSLRLFADAGHDLDIHTPGEAPRNELTPEYPETVTTWVDDVVNGTEPREVRDEFPPQERTSTPLAPLAWWESDWVHLGVLIVVGVGFLTYPIAAAFTWIRRRRRARSERVPDGASAVITTASPSGVGTALGVSGLITLVGFFGYYGTVMFSEAITLGHVIGTRPVIWLVLQALAVLTVVLVILFLIRLLRQRSRSRVLMPVPSVLLLFAGVVFIPWAVYWGLLVP